MMTILFGSVYSSTVYLHSHFLHIHSANSTRHILQAQPTTLWQCAFHLSVFPLVFRSYHVFFFFCNFFACCPWLPGSNSISPHFPFSSRIEQCSRLQTKQNQTYARKMFFCILLERGCRVYSVNVYGTLNCQPNEFRAFDFGKCLIAPLEGNVLIAHIFCMNMGFLRHSVGGGKCAALPYGYSFWFRM